MLKITLITIYYIKLRIFIKCLKKSIHEYQITLILSYLICYQKFRSVFMRNNIIYQLYKFTIFFQTENN